MLPDLDDLRCFEAAAVRLNFRAASNAVALSPAAFSERIKRLEERLGVRLFNRTTRRVRLTAEGERLLPQARKTLAEARACLELTGAPAPFSLTIGTRFELGLSWLVPALAELQQLRPERTLHLVFGDTPDLMDALDKGQIDACVGSMRLTSTSLETALLHEEHYRLVSAPGLREIEGPEDVFELRLVDISGDLPLFRYWQDGQPARQTWRFARHEYMGTIGAIKARVLAGAGVAVLPEYFIREELEDGLLVEHLADRRARSDWFRLVWSTGHARSADLQRLAEALRDRPLR